jgi:flagellar hook-length control protein FliK
MAAEAEAAPGAEADVLPMPVVPEVSSPEGKLSASPGNPLPPGGTPADPVLSPMPDIGLIVRQALAAENLQAPPPDEARSPLAALPALRPPTPAPQAAPPFLVDGLPSAFPSPAAAGALIAASQEPGPTPGTGAGQPALPLAAEAVPGSVLALAAGAAPAGRETPAAHGALVSLPVAVHQPQWGEAFGERVHWLVTQRIQSAQMVLNPPELGPVDIQLKIHQGDASLVFTAAQATVREAIEAALPQLRELLADSGIRLADASVEQRSPEAGRQSDRAAASRQGRSGETGSEQDDGIVTPLRPDGLLDVYV